MTTRFSLLALAALFSSGVSAEWGIRGDLSLQSQFFTDNAIHGATQKANFSLSGNAELEHAIGDNSWFTISPFFRLDQHDDQRSHADLRELIFGYNNGSWEVTAGLGKVFWGVAESSNIVDVINQRDAIEGLDAANKLGQPMINLLLLRDWGEIAFYVLPGFRERTFAGVDGRPRSAFVIDSNSPVYESGQKENHVDVAARVSGSIDAWDLGLHVFEGTAREPLITINQATGQPVPLYYQMTQLGLDVQATLESWLLKAETIYRTGELIEDHQRLVGGFEYSFYGIAGSDTDLGIVLEWLYDDRDDTADHPMQNDALLGLRFALNDEQSSDALLGAMIDLDGGAIAYSLEASRRIGDSFRISAEAVIWESTAGDPILEQFDSEDYLQLELSYYF